MGLRIRREDVELRQSDNHAVADGGALDGVRGARVVKHVIDHLSLLRAETCVDEGGEDTSTGGVLVGANAMMIWFRQWMIKYRQWGKM